MVFNSVHFVVFFAVVYALYRAVPHRAQNWLLLLASYYFYGAWDWRFLTLLLGSTVVDYCCALFIASRPSQAKRRVALVISLIFNLGCWVSSSISTSSPRTSRHWPARWGGSSTGHAARRPAHRHLVLHVHDDELRHRRLSARHPAHAPSGGLRAVRGLLPAPGGGPDPAGVAAHPADRGPAHDDRARSARGDLADCLRALQEDGGRRQPGADRRCRLRRGRAAPGLEVLLGLYAFAFQIYGDFSGYSDIARGISSGWASS